MQLDFITAAVYADGNTLPLEEFDTRYSQDKTRARCYLASHAGTNFRVSLFNHSQDTDLSCALYVDGALTCRHLIWRGNRTDILGVDIDEETVRPFQFSSIELTDNDGVATVPRNSRIVEHIGTLRCELFRVNVVRESRQEYVNYGIPIAMRDHMVLHERTKKVGAHRVRLGEGVIIRPRTRTHLVNCIDPLSSAPYKTFLFRYRPIEMLQAQGIVPLRRPESIDANGARPGPNEAGPSSLLTSIRTATVSLPTGGMVGEPEVLAALRTLCAALDATIRDVDARQVKREASPIVLGAAKDNMLDRLARQGPWSLPEGFAFWTSTQTLRIPRCHALKPQVEPGSHPNHDGVQASSIELHPLFTNHHWKALIPAVQTYSQSSNICIPLKMKLDSVKVELHVGESSLEEYNVRYDENLKSADCYVASQAGSSFKLSVENKIPGLQVDISCSVYIDGAFCDTWIFPHGWCTCVQGVTLDRTTVRQFKFACLEVTDNDAAVTVERNDETLEHMGTIRCDLFRVFVVGDSLTEVETPIPSIMKDQMVFHEKTKKGGTHKVQLGEELKIQPVPTRKNVEYLDCRSGPPYQSFLFRYRPKVPELLQAQGIIPAEKPPSQNGNGKRPGPDEAGPSKRTRTEHDNPAADEVTVKPDSDDEDVEALLAARAALDARIRNAEQRRVKREVSPIVLGGAKGEVIDLTLD
ncbi:hypothetical protein NM688_g3024 [Phlebia brevispora]|uniref:Uncharacterized protein n=1 Tax=Phlebia brevispora TaxID=194682 RepID=A0ACC1T747_9APHY|nr:hypothetical protein NM688_g3024 [Phlebia brevispora]